MTQARRKDPRPFVREGPRCAVFTPLKFIVNLTSFFSALYLRSQAAPSRVLRELGTCVLSPQASRPPTELTAPVLSGSAGAGAAVNTHCIFKVGSHVVMVSVTRWNCLLLSM